MHTRKNRHTLTTASKIIPVTAMATAVLMSTAAATVVAPAAGASALRPMRAATTPNAPMPPKAKVTITEAGSTLLEPLFGLWASGYHKTYPNITITPSGGGSGEGISDAAGGTVSIGASDAYLSGTDRSEYPGIQNVALAISSQMVNYNVRGVPASAHLKLSGTVLSEIYDGKVTTWDDPAIAKLNPGVKLPAEKIAPLHRSDASGDTFLFTTYLSDSNPSGWGKTIGFGTSVSFPSLSGAVGEEGNGGMVSGCKATPGCVAYIGISYRSSTQADHLGEAQLENRSGRYELPTPSTIAAEAGSFTSKTPANESLSMIFGPAASGYPIINYEYAILPAKEANANEADAVKAFLYWAVSKTGGNAAHFLGAVNFAPLPAPVVSKSEKLIAKVGG